MLRSCIMSVAVAVVVAGPTSAHAQWKTPWSYDGARGPAHWAGLDTAYAACNGRRQSPIDIRSAEGADLPPLRFEYLSEPLRYLVNNGKTVRVNYHEAPGAGGALVVAGQRYQLTQFHFHRPSEERVRGKAYPMEVHLMHESSAGRVVGVAVFIVLGHANPVVQAVWDHMPLVEGPEHEIPGVAIDPSGLLPAAQSLGYYQYDGSLTAPPCTEGVTWFVLRTPVELPPAQIAAFARLYPHDVRPVQPLGDRVVRTSR